MIWKCFSRAGVKRYHPEKFCFDCCLWIKKVHCANKYFSVTWMGPIMQSAGEGECWGFRDWQREALSTPQLLKWCYFLLHWILTARLVFSPPWHHEHWLFLLINIWSPFLIGWLEPWSQHPLSLQKKQKETKGGSKTVLHTEYFVGIDLLLFLPVLGSCRLDGNRFWIFMASTESLAHSKSHGEADCCWSDHQGHHAR